MKKKGFEEGRRATARLYTWRSTCPTACHLRRTRGTLPLHAGEVRWEAVSPAIWSQSCLTATSPTADTAKSGRRAHWRVNSSCRQGRHSFHNDPVSRERIARSVCDWFVCISLPRQCRQIRVTLPLSVAMSVVDYDATTRPCSSLNRFSVQSNTLSCLNPRDTNRRLKS